MIFATALVVGLAWLDHAREADATLDDLAAEVATLAASVAGEVRAVASSPAMEPGAALDRWLAPEARLERAGELRVLLRAPGGTTLRGSDGRDVPASALIAALDAHRTSARLSREEAQAVGLPPRMAHAGLATIDDGNARGFGVVVVESAARARDRDRRGERRLIGSALVAVALSVAFGAFASRRQRAELLLARELEIAKLARDRDERLVRAARVATMGTLATGIAHEISTPLGVIAGRAEQLRERLTEDARGRSYSEVIAAQAANIAEIVRRFLHFARGGEPVLGDVDVAALVVGAGRHVQHRFDAAEVSLTTEAPPSLPHLAGDARLLEHAVTNLLLNACAACERGGSVCVTASSDGEAIATMARGSRRVTSSARPSRSSRRSPRARERGSASRSRARSRRLIAGRSRCSGRLVELARGFRFRSPRAPSRTLPDEVPLPGGSLRSNPSGR
jgi:signal transduction histidine kinase